MTSGVKVTKKGGVEWTSMGQVLDLVAAKAVGMVQRRTAKGIDVDGRAMKPYSSLYAMQLKSVGENVNVDLTRSGDYLAGISERSRTVTATGGTVVIGPGTGTSRSMPLPPPYVFSEDKTPEERAEAFADWKASTKSPRRSPSHNDLARYLSVLRPHMGLTADERKKLANEVRKILIKQPR